MKQEQRLLVALVFTIAILFAWSLLFPQARQVPIQPNNQARQQFAERPAAPIRQQAGGNGFDVREVPAFVAVDEPVIEIDTGLMQLGVKGRSGGIEELTADRKVMLRGASPGLLAIEIDGIPTNELEFVTKWNGWSISSVAFYEDVEVSRTITPTQDKEYFSDCVVRIFNKSEQTRSFRPRILAYTPLFEKDALGKRYLYGFAKLGDKPQKIKLAAGQSRDYQGTPYWVASQGKSHTIIVQPIPATGTFHVEHPQNGAIRGWIELPQVSLTPRQAIEWRFRIYSGPMNLSVLRAAGLEEAFTLGFWSGIAKLLWGILDWINGITGNYGVAILVLSLVLWGALFPVTWSGIRTMKVMAEIQPLMKKIQAEHKKNPQKMQKETMALYKKYKMNPLGGCLPMFIQMPIILGLYPVLLRAPQLRGAPFWFIEDLSKPDAFMTFGSKLPLIGETFNILPILCVVTMMIQQKFTMASNAAQTPEQKMQQKMFKFMPLLFGFLFYSLPSGLVLYWVANTTLTITQYAVYHNRHK